MRSERTYFHPATWWGLGLFAAGTLCALPGGNASDQYSIVGTQGWGKRPILATTGGPRINVLEVDAWRHSLDDGDLSPIANVPFAEHELIRPEHFSPQFYLAQIETLQKTYSRQRDILMYYGAAPPQQTGPRAAGAAHRHGLNFNGWSAEDLGRLRALDGRPFIGLETLDLRAVDSMALRLKQAGYGPMNRIYVRICAEPSGMAYGSEDGTPTGKHHTAAAYAAYKRGFARVSYELDRLNRRYGLNIHTVFAGTSAEDFKNYQPPAYLFDALGYDLYVTPENKEKIAEQLNTLRHLYPDKPLVIPELGVATAGPGASPRWAQEALGDILLLLGKHPSGVDGITVFSVNVARRLPKKRWNWAWTPEMFEMLKEWETAPRRWRKEGFHRYDPLSYPVGRDVLYIDRPDLRIVYRKLATFAAPGVPEFLEARLYLRRGRWVHSLRCITF